MKTLSKRDENRTNSKESTQVQYLTPAVNIREAGDHYLLEAEMPGVNKEGLEILVENNELTILGRRKDLNFPGAPVYRESRPLDYRRVFDLDPSIDTSKISAKMDQGVLTLILPKAESVKPRKIAVD